MKAYPHTKHFSDYHDNDNMNGMDLRDYFAAKAMQGYSVHVAQLVDVKWDLIAKDSYTMADAMMKAREL